MRNNIQKKKIIYVITKSGIGGAQRYVYDLATSLPSDAYDVSVATGGAGALVEELNRKKIRVISIPRLVRDINIFNEIFVFVFLVRLFMREKPDIIHLNSSKIGGIGALAGRIARVKKIIFTAHGWAFNEIWRNPISRCLIRFASWMTLILSHHTITVSLKDCGQGQAMPLSAKKIEHIYIGASKERFINRQSAQEMLLDKIAKELPKDALWLGTIAELTTNKGIDYAINSIHRLTLDHKLPYPIIYVIIGGGEHKIALFNKIKRLNLDKQIFLVGAKRNASSMLKAFDLFILPSLKEGLPYTLIEAGLAKLPIIATDVGGVREIIQDMETGILIRPRDVGELEKTILFLLNNKKKRNELGKKIKERVESVFSKEAMVSKTLELY